MKKHFPLLLITTVSLVLAGCGSNQEGSYGAPPAVPVVAATPVVKDITVVLESIGTLQPAVFMEIYPQASGPLHEVYVAEGQWVQLDTPLFQIDPKPYAIKVQEAEAQLAIDRASLKGTQKKLDRFRELARKDFVAQTEWDDLEAQAERALATVDLDEARLASAKLDLDHATVRSPVDGRVGKLDAHPGQLVSAGQTTPLATVSKMDPLIVEFTVTEKEFPKVPKENLQIELTALCGSTPCQKGMVTFLDNHFDPTTGLLLVRGKVLNPDYSLRPGQSIRVHIPVAVESNAILIPQKAIRYNQEGPYVYVVQPDMTVAIRQVVLGSEQGADQIVLKGLDPTEQVILDGHLRLSPGLKVNVMNNK